jgi:hypothetical protein
MNSVIVSKESGQTLDEIQSKLQVESTDKQCFTQLREKHLKGTRFADLQLEMAQEILLSKLVDLHHFSKIYPHQDGRTRTELNKLNETFLLLYKDANQALATHGIDKKVNELYQKIAAQKKPLPKGTDPVIIKEIEDYRTKARNIIQSENARTSSLDLINQGEVEAAYNNEYQKTPEILKCLIPDGDNPEDFNLVAKEKIKANITRMAADYQALQQGVNDPLLTTKQDQIYFSVMHQIAVAIKAQIPDHSFDALSFKLSHKHRLTKENNELKITLPDGTESTIIFNLEQKYTEHALPYSIHKFPGSTDFKLSYGGTRGAEAPITLGMAESYGLKQKYFTLR